MKGNLVLLGQKQRKQKKQRNFHWNMHKINPEKQQMCEALVMSAS